MAGSTYDADGNMLSEAYSPKTYDTDAAGRMHHTFYDSGFEPRVREHEHMGYDGDGMLLKIATSRQENEDPVQNESTYRVRSSVLEGSVVHQAGTASILAGGTRVASHYTVGMGVVGVVWHHKDPSMRSFRSTNASGLVMGSGDSDLDWDSVEADADGKSVGFVDPGLSFPTEPMGDMFEPENPFGSIRGGQFRSYAVDGVMVPESFFISMLEVAFGSQFGLLERSARASRVRGSHYTVGDRRFEWTVRGANAALDEYIEMDGRLPIVQHWLGGGGGDQSWAINWSFQDLTQDQIKKLPSSLSDAKRQKHPNKKGLELDFRERLGIDNGNGTCLEKLNALLKELGSPYKSILDLGDSFFRGRNQLYETIEQVKLLKRKEGKRWLTTGAPMGATTSNGANLEITLNNGLVNPTAVFIHELLHAATGSNATYEHPDIIAAIRRLEGRQDISIDNFIGMYCRKKEEKQK